MILTVTANPLIDRTLHLKSFHPGNIHRAFKITELAGGKGINVARMVKRMGEPVYALTFAGGGYGDRLIELLEQEKIPNATIRTLSQTRFQVSILDTNRNIHTDILDMGSTITMSERESLVFETDLLFKTLPQINWLILSGSAPLGNVSDLYSKLIEIANKHGTKSLLDSYGNIFNKGIKAKPYCIKQNLKEAQLFLNKSIVGKVNILDYLSLMLNRGIELPIISLGKEGAIAGYQGKYWEILPPKVKVLNTTGSGDAFVGALTVSLTKGKSIEESLCWGVAAGTANALVWKPCGCSLDQIKKILPKVEIRQIAP